MKKANKKQSVRVISVIKFTLSAALWKHLIIVSFSFSNILIFYFTGITPKYIRRPNW